MFFNPMGLPQRLIEMAFGSAQPRYTVVRECKGENRGKGKGGVPSLLVLHRSIGGGRPERPRHWHNPADPIQAARIEAAREKRERKEVRRMYSANRSYLYNEAWLDEPSLNPFHVVRS